MKKIKFLNSNLLNTFIWPLALASVAGAAAKLKTRSRAATKLSTQR